MKSFKKLAALALTLCLLATMFPITAFAVTVDSGYCGDNLTWTLDDTGTLTISGTGDMEMWGTSPWNDYRGTIKTVIIEDGVTSIDSDAFDWCTNLQSVTIPESVTGVSCYAFSDCPNLNYNVYNNAKYLGNEDNPYCVLVESLTNNISSCELSPNTKVIADSAFRSCKNLTSILIPNSVTRIGDSAFSGCSSLSAIEIPDKVTSIGYGAFNGCTNLTELAIPDSITSIGEVAFQGCNRLTELEIPDSITSIGKNAFYGCSLNYNVYDNAKYLGNKENPYVVLIESVTDNVTSCVVHPETKLIYSYAFYGCKSLKSVTIPEKVINIGSYAFLSCTSLQSVKMSDGITSVGDGAFGSCTNLRNIVIPDSVTIVGDEAFSGCTSLESITIPDSITAIPDRAFSYCISLQSIIIPESVTFIGWHAFLGCSGLRNITIPDGITSIDISTFCNCVNLQSVKIPHNVTYIRESAFSGCTSLQGITIPETVTSIARGVFSDCTSLNVVYYYGTEEQKNRITIKDENTYLTNAQWHYEVTDVKLGEQVVYHCGCCNKYHSPDGSENVFADIKNTSWQISHAVYACRKGLMAGKGTDANGKIKFDPNSPITREEFVQVLYNAEGKPTVSSTKDFPDVASGGWYKNAVLWAYENNIASGMGNGNFGVGKNITRQDLALMLMKYAALKGCSLNAEAGKIDKFADGDKVSDYAKNAMNWAVTNGILSGKGESGKPLSTFRLDPTGTATRAECAAMLKNFMTAFNL